MMSFTRRTLASRTLLALALAAPLWPSAVLAQESPQAENVAAARTLGIQGIQLADSGDCKGAIEKLSRAESLYHAPTILGRLGECQVQVGQVVLGTENLNRVVREPLAANAPKAFRDAKDRAQRVLSAALPKIAQLTVKVEPADAKPEVRVGSATIPAALIGVERPTDPGTHEVVASAPGYLDAKTMVTLAEGGRQEITLRLEKDPAAAAPAPTPSPEPPPPAPLTTGGEVQADVSPKRDNTLAWVLVGVGGTGLLVGGVTGIIALSKKSDLECEDTRCPPSEEDKLDSARSMATVSTVGFGVGLVGVAVGTVLLATSGGSSSARHEAAPRTAAFDVKPWVGLDSAGVRGSF